MSVSTCWLRPCFTASVYPSGGGGAGRNAHHSSSFSCVTMPRSWACRCVASALFLLLNTMGTGSVSCNSAFILHLCRFLNQEELMERKAMVQNTSSHCRDLPCRKMHPHKVMHYPVHI